VRKRQGNSGEIVPGIRETRIKVMMIIIITLMMMKPLSELTHVLDLAGCVFFLCFLSSYASSSRYKEHTLRNVIKGMPSLHAFAGEPKAA
jgi:hypothetical protein